MGPKNRNLTEDQLQELGYKPVPQTSAPVPFYDPGTELSVPGNPSPNRGNLPVDPAADIYTTRFFPDKPTFTRHFPTFPALGFSNQAAQAQASANKAKAAQSSTPVIKVSNTLESQIVQAAYAVKSGTESVTVSFEKPLTAGNTLVFFGAGVGGIGSTGLINPPAGLTQISATGGLYSIGYVWKRTVQSGDGADWAFDMPNNVSGSNVLFAAYELPGTPTLTPYTDANANQNKLTVGSSAPGQVIALFVLNKPASAFSSVTPSNYSEIHTFSDDWAGFVVGALGTIAGETITLNLTGAGGAAWATAAVMLSGFSSTILQTINGDFPVMPKGALFTSTGKNNCILPVGDDDQIPVADSLDVTGIRWKDNPAALIAGDLGGTTASPKVVGLEGVPLDAATVGSPSNGQIIKYDSASGKYKAVAPIGGGVNLQSGTSYTVVSGDAGKLVSFSNSSAVAVTLTAPATLGSSFYCFVENRGAGVATLSPASGLIDGASSLLLSQNDGVVVFSDGSNFYTKRGKIKSGVNAQSGTSYTVVYGDVGKLVTFTNSSAVAATLTAASTLGSNFYCWLQNRGAGVVTVTPASGTIDGAASVTLLQNEGLSVFSDGSNFYTERGRHGGGVNAQSGTSYTVVAGDHAKLVTLNNASAVAVTLTAAATLGARFYCHIQNLGAGTATLTPASGTIDGASSLDVAQGLGIALYSDGSNFYTERGMGSGGGSVTFAGDLSGDDSSQTVVGLEGVELDATTVGSPSDGDVIKFDSASGKYKAVELGASGVSFAGDLSGDDSSQTVVGLEGVELDATTVGSPSDGDVITYDNGSGKYKATPPSGGGGTTSVFTGNDVTASRTTGTVYQNATGSDMLVIAYLNCSGSATSSVKSDSSNPPTTVRATVAAGGSGYAAPLAFFVKSGDYYSVSGTNISSITNWRELQITKGTLTDSGEISGSRAAGTVYQNTGATVIWVEVQVSGSAGNLATGLVGSANPPTTTAMAVAIPGGAAVTVLFPVLPSQYYKVTLSAGSVGSWREYSWSSVTGSIHDVSTRTIQASSIGAVRGWYNFSGKSVIAIVSAYESATGTLIISNDLPDTAPTAGIPGSHAVQALSSVSSRDRAVMAGVEANTSYGVWVDGGTGTVAAWCEWTFN
jgi:hypothetical protein